MDYSISKKISLKASASKPLAKIPPKYKTFGLDPAIRLYAIEDGYEAEKGEEAEILIIYNSSLAASKKNLGKRRFPYIYTFNHEGTIVINAMRDLTFGVFEHLDSISLIDMCKRLAYT